MTTYFLCDGTMTDSKYKKHLSVGSTGDRVRLIQTMLATLGYSIGQIDGYYGKRTARAVKQFQIVWSLYRDGVVGPETQKTLFGRFSNEFQVSVRDTPVGGHLSATEVNSSQNRSDEVAPDTPVAGQVAVEEPHSSQGDTAISRWLYSSK